MNDYGETDERAYGQGYEKGKEDGRAEAFNEMHNEFTKKQEEFNKLIYKMNQCIDIVLNEAGDLRDHKDSADQFFDEIGDMIQERE